MSAPQTLARGCAQERTASTDCSSRQSIVVTDEFGHVVCWNRGAERLFGYRAEEMVGRPIGTIIPRERADEERELLRRVLVAQPLAAIETERVRKDGRRIRTSLRLVPRYDADGRPIGAIGYSHELAPSRSDPGRGP